MMKIIVNIALSLIMATTIFAGINNTHSYAATAITTASAVITEPVGEASPDYGAETPSGVKYSASISGWYEGTSIVASAKLSDNDTFVAGQTYTAIVTFVPVSTDYYFYEATYTVNGSNAAYYSYSTTDGSQDRKISFVASEPYVPDTILDSGSCGDDVSWVLNTDGELTITGVGDMTNWRNASYVPWYNNAGLVQKIVIEEGVTSIGNYSFYGCSSCNSFSGIPSTVTRIGDYAFYECTNISGSLSFPDGITKIGRWSFYNCKNLSGDLLFPDSITEIGMDAFAYCYGLNGMLKLPAELQVVNSKTFGGCSFTGTLTLPQSLTEVGSYAFQNCNFHGDVIIPQSVTHLGNDVFSGNDITRLIFEGNTPSVSASAFSGNNHQMVVLYDENTIGWESLDWEYISAYPIQDRTIDISGKCGEMATWTLDTNNILTIQGEGSASISGWDGYGVEVKKIVVSDGITSISEGLFSKCVNVEELVLPFVGGEQVVEGKQSVLGFIFGYWGNSTDSYYKYYTLQHYIQSGGGTTSYAAQIPKSLEKVELTSCSIMQGAFSQCIGINEVVLPNSLTQIWDYAFLGCAGLESIIIPDNVSYIGYQAFVGTNLPYVEVPCFTEYKNNGSAGSFDSNTEIRLKHLWENDYSIDSQATCTEEGSKSIHCLKCNATKDSTVIPAGHVIVHHSSKEPTCTEEGWNEYDTCSRCDFTTYEGIPATGHALKEHIIVDAGYLINGEEYDVCSTCDEQYNHKIINGWSTSFVKSFKVSKGKKSFTAKWSKQSAKNQKKFNGYQIRYATKSDMSNAKTTTAKKSSKTKTVKKLKKKTKYYVQVRTYTKKDGETFYSKWSSKKSVKTK